MTPSPDIFERYLAILKASPALAEFENNPLPATAMDLSAAMFDAMDLVLPPGVAFILNSSTGKDSTVTCQAYIWALAEWRAAGRTIRPAVVAIADTGSEFPEMAMRIVKEAEAINAYGIRLGIPLTAEVVHPPVKHRLMVEICGNGKPLPRLTKGSGSSAVSNWCMSRVKAGALKQITERAKALHSDFVSVIGVRSAESTRRAGHIEEYARGFPVGLTAIGHEPGKADLLAMMPIVHWENVWVSDWIRAFAPQWRAEGREELRSIYFKGKAELEGNTECAVTVSEEGQISNSCSDLSGTRFGCWHCLLSVNKSLLNTARNDTRYMWLKKFHKYVFMQHGRNFKRAKYRNATGFTEKNLVPKTHTFRERYLTLMLLLRAEVESGFELLLPEEANMIELLWKKHGVFTVTVADARRDVEQWRKTGRMVPFFDSMDEFMSKLAETLGDGIPAGAFFNVLVEAQKHEPFSLKQGLDLSQLLCVAGTGYGTPMFPVLTTYVLRDRRAPKRFISLVTDTLSVLGTKTNTGLVNGLQLSAWECIATRPPTSWERVMSDGRSFFYQTDLDTEHQKARAAWDSRAPDAAMVLDRFYANSLALATHEAEDPYAEHVAEELIIQQLELTPVEFDELEQIVTGAVGTSEYLTDTVGVVAAQLLRASQEGAELVESETLEGRTWRGKFRKTVTAAFKLESYWPHYQFLADRFRTMGRWIQDGKANTALLFRLAYLARWEAIDPTYAATLRSSLRYMTSYGRNLKQAV